MLKCDHSRSSCSDHVADKNVFLSVSHLLNSFSRNGSSCHVQVLSCRIFPDYIYDKLCFCPICQEYLATFWLMLDSATWNYNYIDSVVTIFLKDNIIQC